MSSAYARKGKPAKFKCAVQTAKRYAAPIAAGWIAHPFVHLWSRKPCKERMEHRVYVIFSKTDWCGNHSDCVFRVAEAARNRTRVITFCCSASNVALASSFRMTARIKARNSLSAKT